MKIRCRSCGHSETLNKELIVTLLGGAVAGFGFWAWVSFLFAGTGFAMPLCIAIVVGGPALAIKYGDEIVEWLAKHGYNCKKCGASDWMALTEEANQQLDQKELQKKSLQTQTDNLLRESETHAIHLLKTRFNTLYTSLIFNKRVLKSFHNLNKENQMKFEQIFGQLQYHPQLLALNNKISGTDVIQLDLNTSDLLLFLQKENTSFLIISISNKNSLSEELKHIKEYY
ncbi:hypothetical protein [Acinetobacter sp. CFCC 10889]|uniref:hypothetical protein n=1 Tax=Acinetobacter sp. CFCC 10889 TaxID=1775557 RepID=UPI001BC88601|nr:hypothetical protein [Acinetobacter sp. CFCC 10889]